MEWAKWGASKDGQWLWKPVQASWALSKDMPNNKVGKEKRNAGDYKMSNYKEDEHSLCVRVLNKKAYGWGRCWSWLLRHWCPTFGCLVWHPALAVDSSFLLVQILEGSVAAQVIALWPPLCVTCTEFLASGCCKHLRSEMAGRKPDFLCVTLIYRYFKNLQKKRN